MTYFVILESGDVNRNICKVKVLDDKLNINGRRGKEYWQFVWKLTESRRNSEMTKEDKALNGFQKIKNLWKYFQ